MVAQDRYEVTLSNHPSLRFLLDGAKAELTVEKIRIQQIVYRIEERRGYPAQGDLWSPGYFHTELSKDSDTTLVASTESWEKMRALSPAAAISAEQERRERLLVHASSKGNLHFEDVDARSEIAPELVLAADQFLIAPAGRQEDAPSPRGRRRDSNRYRRLPLVHRLGPRHHDQPRRLDARDRPPPRGRLDTQNVRPLCSRRSDPQPVSRRGKVRVYITLPTRRCGSSTRWIAIRKRRRSVSSADGLCRS